MIVENIAESKHQMHHCLMRKACANKRYKENKKAKPESITSASKEKLENKLLVKIKSI